MNEEVKELLLTEATRSELIAKSKKADDYAKNNQSKGKNRYERRLKSRIANSVSQYNKIEMDPFFKRDILSVGIDVQGETNNYVVTLRFNGVLREIQNNVKANNGKLEFKIISKSMSRVFNTGDVQIHCTCPDAKYRQNYWQWKNGNGTQVEPRPSDKTNPYDTKGAGCKHTLLVLSNLDWVMKVSSVISNYIKYCQSNLQSNYATYIFPKIYGMPYNKAVQLSLFNNGWFPQDQQTLTDIANKNKKEKDDKGRFIKGNKFRFTKTTPEQPAVNPNQLSLDFDNLDSKKKELVPSEDANGNETETREDTIKTTKEKQANMDTIKKEKENPTYTRYSIFDLDDEGNVTGPGEVIKPKQKRRPGAGRPKKKEPEPDANQATIWDFIDDENDIDD